MLQRKVWVGGKVVELALRLPGGKLLPMDSKWVSSGALEQLADPALDAPRRAQLTNHVEREVERRVTQGGHQTQPPPPDPPYAERITAHAPPLSPRATSGRHTHERSA